MEAVSGQIEAAPEIFGKESRKGAAGHKLLGLASDERLVAKIRQGNDAAFTVLYERYQGRLLSFCRQMLGSLAEAEDAVQQAFINAYRDMVRSDKELQVRPWLYKIARNQSLSMLRARKQTDELSDDQPALAGLSDQVGKRSDLREMLGDLAELPVEQREALVLTELEDNSHTDVAGILGCDREKVKSLVFQARSSLMKSKEARDISCADVQEQLSVLRGGSLRRTVLRRHLKSCDACRAFRAEVKRQRAAMALILPVVPGAALKFGASSALAAAKGGMDGGLVGGSAGAAVGGATTGAAGSGFGSGLAAKLGVSAVAVKGAAVTAAAGLVAASGVVGVQATDRALRDTGASSGSQAQSKSSGSGSSSTVGAKQRDAAGSTTGANADRKADAVNGRTTRERRPGAIGHRPRQLRRPLRRHRRIQRRRRATAPTPTGGGSPSPGDGKLGSGGGGQLGQGKLGSGGSGSGGSGSSSPTSPTAPGKTPPQTKSPPILVNPPKLQLPGSRPPIIKPPPKLSAPKVPQPKNPPTVKGRSDGPGSVTIPY